MMRVVIDTNVLISGLLWQGAPNRILKLVKQGKLKLCVSSPLLEELSNVLRRDKFLHRLMALNISVEEFISGVIRFSRIFPDRAIPPTIKDDLDDDRVLSCARLSGAKCIITGDPHLLRLKVWSGISIS